MVAIVKYNAGNIRSVDHALKRLGMDAVITDDPELIRSADHAMYRVKNRGKNDFGFAQDDPT